MSSELAQTSAGQCLFCSLGCGLEIEEYAPQRWRPKYNGHNDHGLCARGQMVADLLQRPTRCYRPEADGRQFHLVEVIRDLHDRVVTATAAGKKIAIWLDGNVSAEDFAAVHAFCEDAGDTVSVFVHLPPHEFGAAEGLDAAEVPQSGTNRWPQADAFVVIGNPLATHPPVAKELMRWGRERANTPLVVVDSSAGLLTTYTPHRYICRPGHEYWMVAALLGLDVPPAILAESGIDTQRLTESAETLAATKCPAIVIAPQSGGAGRWRALTHHAAQWAKQRGGMVTVLTESANALAITRLMRAHGVTDWVTANATAQLDDAELLFVVGWDPGSTYPESTWRPAVSEANHVVTLGAYPSTDHHWADLTVPVALGPETGGTYILSDGDPHHVGSLLAPPSGVPSIRGFFTRLAAGNPGMAIEPVDVSTLRADDASTPIGVPEPAAPMKPTQPGWPVVLTADPTAYADGQITRHGAWAQSVNSLPELWVSLHDAKTLNLRDGQRVRIRNDHGMAECQVTLAHHQPEFGGCFSEVRSTGRPTGWLAVNGARAEIRRLADWNFADPDESTHAGTIHVEIEPVTRAARREVEHGDR